MEHNLKTSRMRFIRRITMLMDYFRDKRLFGVESKLGELLDFHNKIYDEQEEELQNRLKGSTPFKNGVDYSNGYAEGYKTALKEVLGA